MSKKKKRGRNRPHGHYCRICGQYKANEKFSGRGHAIHVCKACHALPQERRNELENINKIEHISENFFISKENLKRLKRYAGDKRYPESSKYTQTALDAFYRRMDEYHGNPDRNKLTEPILDLMLVLMKGSGLRRKSSLRKLKTTRMMKLRKNPKSLRRS